jgi:hypothetical protein
MLGNQASNRGASLPAIIRKEPQQSSLPENITIKPPEEKKPQTLADIFAQQDALQKQLAHKMNNSVSPKPSDISKVQMQNIMKTSTQSHQEIVKN